MKKALLNNNNSLGEYLRLERPVYLPFRRRARGRSINRMRPSKTLVYKKKTVHIKATAGGRVGVTLVGQSLNSIPDQIRLGNAYYRAKTERLTIATGDEILLRSQSAKVLRHLVTKLGDLVTRDTLIDEVWPDISVTDDSLTQCIADIRRALGDHDRSILKTVPKRGYILHGELVAIPDSNGGFLELAEMDRPFNRKRKIALAIEGMLETVQTIIDGLPSGLRPDEDFLYNDNISILVFFDPTASLHAALAIVKSAQLTIGVNYTNGDGKEAATLLSGSEPGEVLTTQEMYNTVYPGTDFDFHDLGEMTSFPAEAHFRRFRVTHRDHQRIISPQLDPKDVLPTLAILPFHAQSGGSGDMLGTFLADEIANALSRGADVNVISRLSVGAVSNRTHDLVDLGHLLNADFVLSGTLFQKDNTAVVVIEFAETATQFVLWSDRMELSVDPLLRETEGVDQIVIHIRKAIMLNEIRRVRSRPLHDLKLFSVLHGAVGLMHRLSPKEFGLARNYLEYVILKAPNHPAPLSWLARWHVLRVVQGWADDADREARKALNLTARALDIDPDYTLALVCEGQVLVHLANRLDEAQDRYDAALASNPNDAQGLALRGMLAAFQDRGLDGKRDTERALHLTPLDPHRFFFLALAAGANISAENYQRAVALAKESLRLNRTHISTLRMLAVAQEGAGEHVASRKTASELLRLQPNLRVDDWLKSSPSADYQVGQQFASKLLAIGIPK